MNYTSGGYYIVSATKRPNYTSEKVIPKSLFSASSCVSPFYPSLDVLWNGDIEEKLEYAQSLHISNTEYEKLEKWIIQMSDLNLFGYPNVFVDVEYAKTFHSNWLGKASNTKIIGVATLEKYIIELIEFEGLRDVLPEDRVVVENLLLRSALISEGKRQLLGYEILGYIKGTGSFHSYLCNGLEKDYSKHFNFKVNNFGLIETLEEAEKCASFSNEKDLEAEEVLWLPWAIYEYL
ncbi:hypothetical protein O0Q50_21865 [Priestia aryabhattai]|uniref:Uncharacterized protein n=1 Tax=Priestia aryabhattai TaxID=412384 RepID=A0AAX6NDD7_PRIAR|nr:hypothetical protein [Priestia aryabhattai]MDU9693829.1 hypothetical protein [Priestia aryabhattai]